MGLFSSSDDAAYRAARERLERVPDDAPEDQFDAANHAVIEAEREIPWWRR